MVRRSLGDIMDQPVEKSFVQEMREALQKQLSEFELAEKTKKNDATIIAADGARMWRELKDSLTSHVEEINEGLVEPLLSYSENASGNEFSLKHELNDRTVTIVFDPASAVISYQGKIGGGEFRPRVEGDALEYRWENSTPCDVKPGRKFRRLEDDTPPMAFPTNRMCEIIIRCVVLEPAA
jgi:hypothetical protein